MGPVWVAFRSVAPSSVALAPGIEVADCLAVQLTPTDVKRLLPREEAELSVGSG